MTADENPGEEARASGPSDYLYALARRVAESYAALAQTRAVLLTGSAAEGTSDSFSDLDLIVYYDEIPDDEELAGVRRRNGGAERLWMGGDRAEGGFVEAYAAGGVECQVAHTSISVWERDMAALLEGRDVASPLQKALDGTLHGLAMHGDAVIRRWQDRIAAYPDALAHAMVTHYLSFFPIWYHQERLSQRDAVLWQQQALLEVAQHVLGVLAGLNRLYYSTFQFKRMRRLIARMDAAPPELADRIEDLFRLDLRTASREAEALVEETVGLVEARMPHVDTGPARRRLHQRQRRWGLPVP
ncbi:MAG TPA: hypothetical protein VHG35_02520 [Gemmatimonadales bacterium]|nr:hypothetical protein [Gemmatimonadales bacterium]